MHDWMPGMGWGFGPLLMIVFWILVILGIGYFVMVLVSRERKESVPQEREPPLEILKKRYARGEMNKEEFETKRKDLDKELAKKNLDRACSEATANITKGRVGSRDNQPAFLRRIYTTLKKMKFDRDFS
jgi:putative membrane protein